MATKTRAELIAQTLANLGALSAGQQPETEDYAAVDDHVDGVIGELSAKDIVTITDDDAIPVELFNVLADILANDAGPDFGKPNDERGRLVAENKLRTMVRGRPTGEPLQVDYF